MGYRIFLTDGIDTAEMDTENIDTKSIFALLDLQDIGSKKNDIQTLTFKGTKTNNEAFGSFFDFSRESNVSFSNNLFFNYNPLKAVKTYIYEDTELIFVGDLRLTEINVDSGGAVIYNCVVATKLTLLKTALSDKYLADLDFTDLRHHYCLDKIQGWTDSDYTYIETYDPATGTYSSSLTPYGTGYIYPLIDYGFRYSGTSDAVFGGLSIPQENTINIKNFKPALFLREYFNRIFNQEVLNGYTYEIKGSQSFTDMFNQVIIPETNEDVYDKLTGVTTTFSLPAAQLPYSPNIQKRYFDAPQSVNFAQIYLRTDEVVFPPLGPLDNYFQQGTSDYFIKANRNIRTSAKLELEYSITALTNVTDITYVSFRILKTSNEVAFSTFADTYSVNIISEVGSNTISIPTPPGINQEISGTTTIDVDTFSINAGEYLAVAVSFRCDGITPPLNTTVVYKTSFRKSKLSLPGSSGDTLNYLSIPSSACTTTSDIIAPKAPVNVKQLDFLKSIINQFNFVVYTEKDNYRHFIFELYDDFYAKMVPQYLITNAVDWTNKIDYTKGLQIKPNIELPKSYLYTYKSDIDFLNTTYKTKYNEIYGQFSFNDELGLVDQKKVELLFAPTIIASINNISMPLYYKVDNNVVKTTKIVPRILYYNGYYKYNNAGFSLNYWIAYQPENSTYIEALMNFPEAYPQVSNYYIDQVSLPTNLYNYEVINDIHFNQPREIYFQNVNNKFTNVPNSYTNYYINQVTELTDENVIFVDCDVYLTEFDIANLDLSVPVYIQTGNNNGAYFKIINVEYENKDLPSRVKLQKIVI